MPKVNLHGVALECYLDGGDIAVYSINFVGKQPHPDDVIEFCKGNPIGIADDTDINISTPHLSMDNSNKIFVLVRFKR